LTSAVPEETTAANIPVLAPDDAYPIPDVPPDELLNYINKLAVREPTGETKEAYRADMTSRTKSRLIAADRILLSQDLDTGLVEAGVIAKLDALRTLALVDPQGLGVHFESFVESIMEGDSPRLALIGRVSLFQYEIDRLNDGLTNDPEPLVAQLREILADPLAGYAEFLATQYAGVVLDARGFPDRTTEVLNMVGQHFAKADDEKLAEEAKSLLRKTAFRSQVMAAMQGKKSDVEKLTASVQQTLGDTKQLDVEVLDTTLNAGQMLEFTGSFAAARQIFNNVRDAFANHQDKSLAQQASRSVENALKRLDLVGTSIDIEGVHIDGSPFDWQAHRGKVVLIDFWATWSKPWEDSLPELKSAYERFHEDGFEVIGVNLDENRNEMYNFVRAARIPWPLVMDETGGGLGNSNAIKYGVEAVPFVVLVGRDGKVADIHIHGQVLPQRVEELLRVPSSSARGAELETATR
jgi:thiol-disulfide isomerase/thioredoxin